LTRRLGKFSIVIDANEYHVANTWEFPNHTVAVKSLLKYGCDYTVRGYLGIIGVERKAWNDYVRGLGKRWPTFQRQLDKLQRNKYYCVIVEGNIDDPISPLSDMTTEAITIMTAKVIARGVPVIFAGHKYRATRTCIYYFEEIIRRIQDGL
jgi:ERCC4-type nuclease